ncbi:zinc-dependent metalloprotease family protein [Nocardioides houyundeii]|uniref:zinc-dependent metalloprotease family protein n=1 Tax=Nocardioides houyundeii TaxID=2045452 RepID=UPI000C78136A|nr:zinc-dependent metalloprotease family protein [Nocardioides houyundeii]
MRISQTRHRPPLRLGFAALGALALSGAALAPLPSTAQSPSAYADQAPALFSAAAPVSARSAGPAAVEGRSRLVTLDPTALPAAAGRRVGLPLADGAATARVEAVDHEPTYTAWRGTLEGVPMSSFTVVQVGDVYRGSVISPEGVHTLTHADGGNYWLTDVAERKMPATDDARPADGADALLAEPAADAARQAGGKKRGKVKIGVMFGYTKAARLAAGGKAGIKSAAALVVSQTNDAFANSGLKVKIKLRGVVKAKGKESANPIKDAFRVSRARDGRFDNLQRVRRRHHADIVHLFTSGDSIGLCGGGLIPYTPRSANPAAGASVSTIQCLPYLVATHEIGHNLGADHNKYPGVSHASKLPYSYGFANPAGNYISVMSYYNPCEAAGIYTCVRVPFFSSPKNTYYGQPLADSKRNNNTKVIRLTAPKVARYVR